VSEPFGEENLIRVYRECPSEVKDLFLQEIVKLEHLSESLSFPMNVSIMVIEVMQEHRYQIKKREVEANSTLHALKEPNRLLTSLVAVWRFFEFLVN
jgi:hypothetical protein